jgi:hypothetical protein
MTGFKKCRYVSSTDSAKAKIVKGVVRKFQGSIVGIFPVGPVSFKDCFVGFA